MLAQIWRIPSSNLEMHLRVWMTLLVHYEPVNPNDETHKGFDAYLSAIPTRIFKNFEIVNGWGNHYRNEILAVSIKTVNSKFIRYKSGLGLAGIKRLYLKIAVYESLH